MQIKKFILLFILFLLGRHLCFPSSPRYLELADSADFFIARENWSKAEDKIIEAMRLEPANFSNSLLLANLGLIQSNQGKYTKAIETLSLGLQMAPSSTVLLNNRAHTFLLMDSIDPAIRDLERSLDINAKQEWPLQTRAFIYLQEGDIENSKKLFLKVKNINPENSVMISALATIADKEQNFDEAISLYKRALEIEPDDNETREAYIFLLIKTNDYPSARVEIREALKLNPEHAMFYLLRGYLHRLNYRLDEAQADKKIAIAKGLDANYASTFIP